MYRDNIIHHLKVVTPTNSAETSESEIHFEPCGGHQFTQGEHSDKGWIQTGRGDKKSPKFASLWEFEQWHMLGLEQSVTRLEIILDSTRLAIDRLDDLRFKIVVVIFQGLTTLMIFLYNHHFSTLGGNDDSSHPPHSNCTCTCHY
jgi:hypothetical protein